MVESLSIHTQINEPAWVMTLVETEEQLHELIGRITVSKECAIDTETDGLYWALGKKAFMATFSPDLQTTYAIDFPAFATRVLVMMELNKFNFIFHNAVFDLHMLRAWTGWRPAAGYRSIHIEDTMYGFRILYPGQSAALKVAAKRYAPDVDVDGPQKKLHEWMAAHRVVEKVAKKTIIKEPTFDEVPENIMLPYATQDAWMTLNSFEGLHRDMLAHERAERFKGKLPEMIEVYDNECRLIKTITEMERAGFPVDKPTLEAGLVNAAKEIERLAAVWHEMGYGEVNPGSSKQLSKLLYETLGEKVKHRTKGDNPATDEFALRDLDNKEIGTVLMELRGWKKYQERMLEVQSYINPETGCVHSSFKGDGARTGRFSSADPALQNHFRPNPSVPYTMTRDVFRPPAGYEFLFMDFSQIELRLAAEYLKDEDMKQSFVNGVDFHSLTAARTYGVDIKDVTKDQRALSKILNFSILYGAGLRRITFALRYGAAGSKPLTPEEARAALKQFKWESNETSFKLEINPEDPNGPPLRTDYPKRTVDDLTDEELYIALAGSLLGAYHRENPLVKQFTNSASRRAEREGYVMTAFGLMIPVPKERSHIAANAIIQGSAAGLMKATLTRGEDICYDYCAQNSLEMWNDVKMITTIHDEFGIMLPVGHALPLARMLYPRMIDWPQFSVKLDVEFAIVHEGSSWAFKKDLDLAA